MSIPTNTYISVCLYLRAHFKKYEAPLPDNVFKTKYGRPIMVYFISQDIIRVVNDCYPDPLNEGMSIAGLELTFHGLWILFRMADKRIKK